MDHIVTLAELQKVTGEPRHRLHYALIRFGPPERGRIGLSRFWSPEDLPAVLESLKKTATKSTIRDRRMGAGK